MVEWLRGIPTTTLPEIGVYFSLSRAERGLPMSDGGLIVGGTYKGRLAFGSTTSTNTSTGEYLYFAKFDATGTAQWAISSDSPGFGFVHYFGPASGERARFAARVWQPVSLPGISTITATSDDTVLVELGPPEIVMPPLIGMSLAGDKIVLAWPATATGFALEWATNLPPSGWTSNSAVPVVVGGNLTVTNPISGGIRFFRLKK
jgi:hypothetical protein